MTTRDSGSATLGPPVGNVSLEQPWLWLASGWKDYWRRPGISLTYGCAVAGASGVLTYIVFDLWGLALVLPLAAGFLIVAPLLAVGLYETSRRLHAEEEISMRNVIFVAVRSPTQLAFVGVALMLFMLAWIRLATLIFALFFGLSAYPPMSEWIGLLLFTPTGLAFLAVGTVIGGVLAVIAYAISVVSIPMLMVRDVDAITAIVTSARAVLANPGPMLLWAWLIAMLTAVGIATFYIGLIVTFPLIGYATWHAYKSVLPD